MVIGSFRKVVGVLFSKFVPDGCLRKFEFFSDIVSVFQSPLNGKACRAKYRMLDRIESKIFLFLLFSNAIANDQYYCCGCRDISCNCLHMRIRRFVFLKSSLFPHCNFPVGKSMGLHRMKLAFRSEVLSSKYGNKPNLCSPLKSFKPCCLK